MAKCYKALRTPEQVIDSLKYIYENFGYEQNLISDNASSLRIYSFTKLRSNVLSTRV